jgi:hypothetical protein
MGDRAPNAGSSCVGTDPCRNSATGWGGQGSSCMSFILRHSSTISTIHYHANDMHI